MKPSEPPRSATSAWERSFWSQMASNSPKTNDFGAKHSVSRRPITVAVFRREVRHQRAPARRSTRSYGGGAARGWGRGATASGAGRSAKRWGRFLVHAVGFVDRGAWGLASKSEARLGDASRSENHDWACGSARVEGANAKRRGSSRARTTTSARGRRRPPPAGG